MSDIDDFHALELARMRNRILLATWRRLRPAPEIVEGGPLFPRGGQGGGIAPPGQGLVPDGHIIVAINGKRVPT